MSTVLSDINGEESNSSFRCVNYRACAWTFEEFRIKPSKNRINQDPVLQGLQALILFDFKGFTISMGLKMDQ